MRVTLFHNPGAGEDDHSGEQLCTLIADAGHDVSYVSLKDDGWERAFDDGGDLVVVAGGDGSVGKVLKEIPADGASVTLLPVGSANNIARSLGIADADLERLVRGWAEGELRRFDLGRAAGTWGEKIFVESIGGGVFGEVLRRAEGVDQLDEFDGEEKVDLGLELFREVIEGFEAEEWGVEIEGEDHSGSYLGVELMNIGELGPNLPLAPGASPYDGLLDVVPIREEDRADLVAYLSERLRDLEPSAPEPERLHGARISLRPPPETPLHLDDEAWPQGAADMRAGEIEASFARSLPLLVPRLQGTCKP
jgi:diacylglycerol kinase family enzyme